MIVNRLGIVGSRDAGFTMDHLTIALDDILQTVPKLVVSGGAKGVDTLAKEWADLLIIETKIFEAEWKRYAKGAGNVRNERLVRYLAAKKSSHLVAFWDGTSTGTKNALGWCVYYHLPYTVFTKEFFYQL